MTRHPPNALIRNRTCHAAASLLLLTVSVAAQHVSDVIFDPAKLRTVRVTMAEAAALELVTKPELGITYPCTFDWDGNVLADVGIKAKGQGSRIGGTKPSVRFRFNEFKDQEFLKLKRLDAQAMKFDASMMRERLVYGTFRRRGIVAPRAMHALLYVNNVYFGLYTLLDQFDQAEALRIHLPSSNGNLYKGANSVGPADATLWRGAGAENYIGPLYSWERKQTTAPDDLVNLIHVVNNVTDEELAVRLPTLIDVDQLLEYRALNQVMANEDWLFNDVTKWASPLERGATWSNNYYFYFDPKSGRASTIVWDVDVSMNDAFTPETWTKRSVFRGFELAVLSRRVMQNAAWRDMYVKKVLAIVDGAFDPGTMTDEIDRIYAQIKTAAEADGWKIFTNTEFHNAVAGLRSDIPVRVGNVRKELGCPESTSTSYGAGCAPVLNGDVPVHDMTGIAVLGRSFELRVRKAPANAQAILLIGGVQTSVDLTVIGMPGCTMLADPAISLTPRTSASGMTVVGLTVPADSRLVGIKLFTQYAVDNPGAGRGELPIVASNGLQTVIAACQ